MNNLYEQLVDLVKQKSFELAKRIPEVYGKQASHVYPSYHHVVVAVARLLEQTIHVPVEIIKDIIAVEGLTFKLGETALPIHVKDEDGK